MAKTTKKVAKKVAATGEFLEKANNVHALAYVPYFVGAAVMYFLGKSDKKAAMHHIKYSAILAGIFLIIVLVANGYIQSIANVAYLVISGFFAFKAYKGEEVKIEILDTIEEKITDQIKK